MLIGVLLNMILYGILIMQVRIWFGIPHVTKLSQYRSLHTTKHTKRMLWLQFEIIPLLTPLYSDRLHIKLLVWYLFACETANTLLDCAMMYEPLIIKYGTTTAPF
jgi:hypothetical protein